MDGAGVAQRGVGRSRAVDAFARRQTAGRALADCALAIADACETMATRFRDGGKLIAFGNGPASTDAQHIAVEFIHPVIVGKRALPAICLTNDVATITGVADREGWDEVFAHQLRYLGRPQDIALGLISPAGPARNVLRGLVLARQAGLATVAFAFAGGGDERIAADHVVLVQSTDPLVVKEMQVTVYHVIWELTHVFLEQPIGAGR